MKKKQTKNNKNGIKYSTANFKELDATCMGSVEHFLAEPKFSDLSKKISTKAAALMVSERGGDVEFNQESLKDFLRTAFIVISDNHEFLRRYSEYVVALLAHHLKMSGEFGAKRIVRRSSLRAA